MLTGLFKDASFGPLLNLHMCIFLFVGLFRFGQCLGNRFSPIPHFFSLVSFPAFRDAPHSRFWCRDPKVCLRGSLKVLDLALSQIYTRLFHLRKFVALHNAWVKDSYPFMSFFHSRVFSN